MLSTPLIAVYLQCWYPLHWHSVGKALTSLPTFSPAACVHCHESFVLITGAPMQGSSLLQSLLCKSCIFFPEQCRHKKKTTNQTPFQIGAALNPTPVPSGAIAPAKPWLLHLQILALLQFIPKILLSLSCFPQGLDAVVPYTLTLPFLWRRRFFFSSSSI